MTRKTSKNDEKMAKLTPKQRKKGRQNLLRNSGCRLPEFFSKYDVCILMSQNRREYNRSSDWSIKVKLSDLLGNYDRKADKPTNRQTDNVCIQNKSKETVRSNEESDAE